MPPVNDPMPARMLRAARERREDAEILSGRIDRASDGPAFLSLLAFEIYLKAAARLTTGAPVVGHNYRAIWRQLSPSAAESIVARARARIPGYGDLSDLPALLDRFEHNFKKVRYAYEFSEGRSDEEERARGQAWLDKGGPLDEADLDFRPMELASLTEALDGYLTDALGPTE